MAVFLDDNNNVYHWEDHNPGGEPSEIFGLGGRDTITGDSGRDIIHGGNDRDILKGFGGDDTLFGDDGDDVLYGWLGADHLSGGAGIDTASYSLNVFSNDPQPVRADLLFPGDNTGEAAGDTYFMVENLIGGAANDGLGGDNEVNKIEGLSGDDVIGGRGGNDQLYGDSDNDILYGDAGGDRLDGGDGSDYASYIGSTTGLGVDLIHWGSSTGEAAGDSFFSIENLQGSHHDDHLGGDNLANIINALNGHDFLGGRGGNDQLYGDDGNDTLSGDAGGDFLDGGNNIDYVSYVSAPSLVFADFLNPGSNFGDAAGDGYFRVENLQGSQFSDRLGGDNLANIINALNGNDILSGHGGNDQLYGDDNNDTLIGGVGTDFLDGGNGVDTASYAGATALVHVDLLSPALNIGEAAGDGYFRIENLQGTQFGDHLSANNLANVLNGGAGADLLAGRSGSDGYFVDHSGDLIVEIAGQGTDNVRTSTSYTLKEAVSVETLQTLGSATTTAINLTGNELANTVIGNAAANVINGGGGVDVLSGMDGNDSYFVDSAGDKVVEAANQGTDNVRASTSYVLTAGSHIETLQTLGVATTPAINLTGNELANTVIGNAGANVINGGGGIDTLRGMGGNDSYFVDNAGDKITEAVAGGTDSVRASTSYALAAGVSVETLQTLGVVTTYAVNLYGNEIANTIFGNAGTNVIAGGGGNDTLSGRGGSDVFRFNTALNATTNKDIITDFLADDTIQLDDAIFTALATGALPGAAFRIGAAAADTSDRIIYNQTTGQLFYDFDGTTTVGQVLFATLSTKPALTSLDFVVI